MIIGALTPPMNFATGDSWGDDYTGTVYVADVYNRLWRGPDPYDIVGMPDGTSWFDVQHNAVYVLHQDQWNLVYIWRNSHRTVNPQIIGS